MKVFNFILFLIMLQLSLFAGPIYDSYKKTEQKIFSLGDDPAEQSKQLRSTLLESLKSALVKFYNYRYQGDKDVAASDVTYEAAEERKNAYYAKHMTYEAAKETKNAYYVKYKNFFAYFTYRHDPKLYYLSPLEQKVITDPTVDVPRFEVVIDGWDKKKKSDIKKINRESEELKQ